jgi:hypothetical protein
MKKIAILAGTLLGMLLGGGVAVAQAGSQPPAGQPPPGQAATGPGAGSSEERANVDKARAILNAMVRALGGAQWLAQQNVYMEGRVSGFYQGKPTGAISDFHQWRTPSGEERVELGKKHDDIEVFAGQQCWEITYRGKKPLPKEICDDFLRRKAHSIDVAIRYWLKDPNTILISEGQTLSERHLTDQVTLISPANDSITIQIDAETHLPSSRTFQWRDPLYKDKNEEREEYDNYHTIDGIPTPFSITRFHNGDENNLRSLYKAAYNVPLPQDAFNADAAAAKVKK